MSSFLEVSPIFISMHKLSTNIYNILFLETEWQCLTKEELKSSFEQCSPVTS